MFTTKENAEVLNKVCEDESLRNAVNHYVADVAKTNYLAGGCGALVTIAIGMIGGMIAYYAGCKVETSIMKHCNDALVETGVKCEY